MANHHPRTGFEVEAFGEVLDRGRAERRAPSADLGTGPGQFRHRRHHSIRTQGDIMRGKGTANGVPVSAIVELLIGERHGTAD